MIIFGSSSKTGSCSVIEAIIPHLSVSFFGDENPEGTHGVTEFMSVNFYDNTHFKEMLGERYVEAHKFTIFRNPKHRVISAYNYLRGLGYDKFQGTLEQVLEINPMQFTMHEHAHFLKEQATSFDDGYHVIRFETMNQDFPDYMERITGKRIELPFVNKTPHYFINSISPKESELIRAKFPRDIAFHESL